MRKIYYICLTVFLMGCRKLTYSQTTDTQVVSSIKELTLKNSSQTLCSRYIFGFNGQEMDNEVSGTGNTNTAMFWEYDTRLGRRWNMDPVVKPWQSPYACFSGNPIWRIDPDGDDDFFNADGTFSHSTSSGTKIFVITAKGTESFSKFSASKSNTRASRDIVCHYRYKAGISASTELGVSPNTSGLSGNAGNTIAISTKGGASPLFNDYNNMISALFHEKTHLENGDSKKKDFSYKDHLAVYDKQMGDASFAKTTNEFKGQVAANYASYLAGGVTSGVIKEDEAETLQNNFNTTYKKYGLEIKLENDYGKITGQIKSRNNDGTQNSGTVQAADKPR